MPWGSSCIFDTIAISGVGLIGGSVGLAARQYGLARHVIGIGRNPEKLERAIQLEAIDEYSLVFAEAACRCDLLYLATPVRHIIHELDILSDLELREGCVVTDGGSSKVEIVLAASRLKQASHFVGGHPMAGLEQSGVEYASSSLYQGAAYVLTPTEVTSLDALKKMRAFVIGLGSRLVELAPAIHDRLTSASSHLPHVAAGAFLRVAEQAGIADISKIAAGSFRDLTRVADSSPEMWKDICLSNRYELIHAIDLFSRSLDEVKSILESADEEALARWFGKGQEIRSEIFRKEGGGQ